MFKWIIALSLFFVAPHVFAADCKGRTKSSCTDKCYWVSGKKMKSHCRSKPGNASTTKYSKSKKAKSNKKSKKEKTSKKKDSKTKDKKKSKKKKDKKKKKKSKKSS